MEDSYTVHRRRKAAAKRREKTPEPSSRIQLIESSDEREEEVRRAKMEKMAEDTERMEQIEIEKRKETAQQGTSVEEEQDKREVRNEKEEKEAIAKRVSPISYAKEMEEEEKAAPSIATSSLLTEVQGEVSPVKGVVSDTEHVGKGEIEEMSRREMLEIRENVQRSRDTSHEIARKSEKRQKKKSKDRGIEKHNRSTDSSDERSETSPRRTKSSESRMRTKKSSGSRSRASEKEDANVAKDSKSTKDFEEMQTGRLVEEAKGYVTGLKYDEFTDQWIETRRSSVVQESKENCSELAEKETKTMRKSETFPQKSSERSVPMKRSATELKKQVIPLSNDSLIEDFAKAQREYLLRERSILDPDPPDEFQDAIDTPFLRKRKISVMYSEAERQRILECTDRFEESKDSSRNRWYWLNGLSFLYRSSFFGFRDKEKVECNSEVPTEHKTKEVEERRAKIESSQVPIVEIVSDKVTLLDFFRALKDVAAEFKAFVVQNPHEAKVIRMMRNRCAAELIVVMIYCGLGAFVFRFTEGAFEIFYKCGVKRVKRDFLDSLWNYSHNLKEEDWKSLARRKLMEFEEQLHTAHEAGLHTYSGQRSWSFLNAVIYCLTVITTIGYGHISPSTTTGRALTIVYAIFGIPMFLIVLADFGKLFTRAIKFLWAFVRRLYYTGSCRKARRTVPVQEVMKGVQLVYDLATFKRPSQVNPQDIEEMQRQQQGQQAVLNIDGSMPNTPGTPAMSTFTIDDEFNLPISVAIFILLGYIFVGATAFNYLEGWGFFESFYFVFISMSTIGFGDYVPKRPMYMMYSIIYLMFGLALTSMCINVVQVMLSDKLKQASQKIGATIGLEITEDDNSVKPAPPPAVEVAEVHVSVKEAESMEKIAPKAKQEDMEF